MYQRGPGEAIALLGQSGAKHVAQLFLEESVDRMCQGGAIRRRDDQPGLTIDHGLGQPTHCGGDHRHAIMERDHPNRALTAAQVRQH